MKSFLLIFLISFSAMASNWMPIEGVKNKSTAGYQLEKDCPGKCVDVGNNVQAVQEGLFTLKPVYGGARKSVDECSDQEACEALLTDKKCLEKQKAFIDKDYKFVYCMDEVTQDVVFDQAAINQKTTLRAQRSQYEGAIGQAQKAMDCGRRVMSALIVRNAPKALKTNQIKDLVKTYQETKSLLETGSLVSARESILAIVPDGTIVTEADKTALVAELDACKP